MGKGLSKLQKEILLLAYKNRNICLVRDVLTEVYKFPPKGNIQDAKPGALIFERKKIGLKKYQAASVSVAKSFNRLTTRGLVHREYSGVRLTPHGVKLMEGWLNCKKGDSCEGNKRGSNIPS